MPIKRAAIYVRLSRETEESTSPTRQRKACERLCRDRGWDVVFVEEDLDVSATKRGLDRPALDRLRARYGELDAVVYWKTDRLARSLLDFASLMAEAEEQDVALVSATEPLDLSDPMGRAMAQIVAIFAELEARRMGERSASAIAHLRRTGRADGGILPYWLDRIPNPDGPGYVLALHPERAPIAQEAAHRLIAGESLYSIARDYTERGLPTVRGGSTWNPVTLSTWFRNRDAVLGFVVHRGERVLDDNGDPLRRPALLDAATYDRLRAALDGRKHPEGRHAAGRSGTSLLGGLATCGACGHVLYSRGPESLSCGARVNGRQCPDPVSVSRRGLEAHVSERFLASWGTSPEVRRVVETTGADIALAEIDHALADVASAFSSPSADVPALLTRREALLARRAETEATPPERRERFEPTGRTVAEAWEAADDDARRALLRETLGTLVVDPAPYRGSRDVASRVRALWVWPSADVIGSRLGESDD